MKKAALLAVALAACTVNVETDPIKIELPEAVIRFIDQQNGDAPPSSVEAIHRIVDDVTGRKDQSCESLMNDVRDSLITLFPEEDGFKLTFDDGHYIMMTLDVFRDAVLVTAQLFDEEDNSLMDVATTCQP